MSNEQPKCNFILLNSLDYRIINSSFFLQHKSEIVNTQQLGGSVTHTHTHDPHPKEKNLSILLWNNLWHIWKRNDKLILSQIESMSGFFLCMSVCVCVTNELMHSFLHTHTHHTGKKKKKGNNTALQLYVVRMTNGIVIKYHVVMYH